jgi:hypothetical protein
MTGDEGESIGVSGKHIAYFNLGATLVVARLARLPTLVKDPCRDDEGS